MNRGITMPAAPLCDRCAAEGRSVVVLGLEVLHLLGDLDDVFEARDVEQEPFAPVGRPFGSAVGRTRHSAAAG